MKIEHVNVSLDKSQLVIGYQNAKCPTYVVDGREKSQHAQPEPHEYVNDLIEEIDAQNALNSPIVRVANFSYLKVAISHSGKMSQLVPLLATQQHLNDLYAERVIIISNETIE